MKAGLLSEERKILHNAGDIDCVYHVALYELRESLEILSKDDALESLDGMIDGKRLKDISDLPLDLAD